MFFKRQQKQQPTAPVAPKEEPEEEVAINEEIETYEEPVEEETEDEEIEAVPKPVKKVIPKFIQPKPIALVPPPPKPQPKPKVEEKPAEPEPQDSEDLAESEFRSELGELVYEYSNRMQTPLIHYNLCYLAKLVMESIEQDDEDGNTEE